MSGDIRVQGVAKKDKSESNTPFLGRPEDIEKIPAPINVLKVDNEDCIIC